MAAFTNYGELKTEIANVLARSDLTADIPSFVQQAEAWIAREVRLREGEQTTTGSLTIDQAYEDMPAGFIQPIHFVLDEDPIVKLEIVSWDKRTDVINNSAGTDKPRVVSWLGKRAYFAPIPSAAYNYTLTYYGFPTALSADPDTNDLFTDAPDLLLYAALTYSAPFVGDDPRLATWITLRNEAAKSLGKRYFDSHAAGGILTIRPDVVKHDGHR